MCCVCFVLLCAVCVLFCCVPCPSGSLGYTRVRALTQFPPVWSPAFSSLEMLYKCDLNLTLKYRNCVYHSNLFFTCNACRMYLSFFLLMSTPISKETSDHSTVLFLPSFADVICATWLVICNLCLYEIVSAVYLRASMCWCWGKTQSGTLIPRSLPPVMRFALGLIKHIWLFLSNNHQGRCYSSFVPQFVLPLPSFSATWDLEDLILSPFLPFHCIMRGPVGQIL